MVAGRGVLVGVVSAVLVLVVGYADGETLNAAAEIESHLDNRGPAFEAGLTPAKLGWGADDKAYPDRFVVNPMDGAEMVWLPAGRFRMGSTQKEINRLWQENGWDPEWRQDTRDEQPAAPHAPAACKPVTPSPAHQTGAMGGS
jgi:hypothetical protein